jgi:hypothetical protein
VPPPLWPMTISEKKRRLAGKSRRPRRPAASCVDPSVMRDLQRCCSNCDSKQLCVHELEDKPKGAIWPKYCSNEQTIEALMTKLKLPKALHRR